MAAFNMSSLPMMSGAIYGIIKLPSTIDLKSSLSDKFRPSIKFDKTNTIITNLTANMAQKRIENMGLIQLIATACPPSLNIFF